MSLNNENNKNSSYVFSVELQILVVNTGTAGAIRVRKLSEGFSYNVPVQR